MNTDFHNFFWCVHDTSTPTFLMNFHVIKYSEKIHIFLVDYIILLFICAYYCKNFYLITLDSKKETKIKVMYMVVKK